MAQSIETSLEREQFVKPGSSGVFGNLAFSHDLIHRIGGQEDSNRNTTQRVLLLLESTAINNRETRRGVIKNILNRYLANDASLLNQAASPQKIPRFLLNDIVRFWRTMAVDYANKLRERHDGKWALRNVKLRMSRKLIFVSGMLMCFSPATDPPAALAKAATPDERLLAFLEQLLGFTERTPLDILAQGLLRFGHPETTATIIDCYDRFLAHLDEHRDELKGLQPAAASESAVFRRFKEFGHAFQEGLTKFFFEEDQALAGMIKQYGVF